MPFFSPYSYAGGVSRALVRFFRESQLPASLLAPFSSRTRPLTAVRLLPCPFQGFSLSVA